MSNSVRFGAITKLPACFSRACGLWLPGNMTCSLEAQMLTQGSGYHGGGAVTKNIHHTSGLRRLAVKWWGQSTVSYTKKQIPSKWPKVDRSWHTKLFILWILVAAMLATYTFYSMNTDIKERRKETLASMCDERARMLQDQFDVSMNHVHALAILVSTFHHRKNPSAIDQKTFAEYTARTAFERPLLSGVAYAQKVLHSEREQFERQQGWKIKMMKSKEPSPIQDEYAPAIFSQETIYYIESLDMMSGEEDRENILRARATGKGVLTSPFRLLESNHLGVVLTFAVYNTDLPPDATPEERIQATAGYLGGAFDVESLVENLLRQLAGNQAIVVNVYDITNSSNPLIMYGPQVTDNGMPHVSSLDFGDPFRRHVMHCRFNENPATPWSAITTSFGIFVIAVLVGHIIHAAKNRIAKVEEDFRKMEELKKQAEAADIAKSQFLATVSHEIRTPMNGVLGMLQMLMDTDLDATQQDYARTAQASGKALITLINEVLDQAKIESGRLELEAVPFDLRSVLDDVLSLFSGKSRDKGIELAVFVSHQVPDFLIGDPGRFRQIITNLVGNSVKFTERGHIYVCVHLAEKVKAVIEANAEACSKQLTEDDKHCSTTSCDSLSGVEAADRRNGWETFRLLLSDGIYQQPAVSDKSTSAEASDTVNLIVSVEDTGVGIPLHAQGRVFTPFMQADSSTVKVKAHTQRVDCAAADRKARDEKSKICICGALNKRGLPFVAMTMEFTPTPQRSSSRRSASHSRFYRDLASPVKIDFSSQPQHSLFSGSWPDGPPPPPTLSLHDQVEDVSHAAHYLKTLPPTAPFSSVSFRSSSPPDESGSFGRASRFHTPRNLISRFPISSEGDKENESPQNEPRGLLELPPLEEVERPHSQTNGAAGEQCWVTVYGFTPQNTNLVLREFEKCGTILKHVLGPEGANFVHILYQNTYDLQRALQKNGVQISLSLMVGVKPMAPFQSQTFTEKANTGFMVLPPRSPGKVAASTSATKASSRPYYLQQSNERGQRFSGAIASPSKSTILKIVDLIFGV